MQRLFALLCGVMTLFVSFYTYTNTNKGLLVGGVRGVPRIAMSNTATKVHNLVCEPPNKKMRYRDWRNLCSSNFVKESAELLLKGEVMSVVQIGAHTGFEQNDPIANGLSRLLKEVAAIVPHHVSDEVRQNFHWAFIEPSPANFKKLTGNLAKHSVLCDMRAVNAAVIPESLTEQDTISGTTKRMVFYSLRDTIDPETGYDSISGKMLPPWITQVSSFSKEPILTNEREFTRLGLNVNDYIVEIEVDTKSYSNLMREVLDGEYNDKQAPLLVLIDTEGFDCNIIQGISASSPYLPKYLVYEHKSCDRADYLKAMEHLKSMGYDLLKSSENMLAVRKEGVTVNGV